jgi:hypothetical protein
MLRVKFNLKYIMLIYYKWGERKTIYGLLNLTRKIKSIMKNNDDVICLRG